MAVAPPWRCSPAAAAGRWPDFSIFAGTLFPVLGFLNVYPFLFSFVADHFQYLAMLGDLVPAGLRAGTLLAHWPGRAAPRSAPRPHCSPFSAC